MGTKYDFKVIATADWTGDYKLHMVVSSAAPDLLVADVTITYKIGDAGAVTEITTWDDATTNLVFDLPQQASTTTYTETYYFTIVVNNPITGVYMDFSALSLA